MAKISLPTHRKFRRLTRALGSPALAWGTLELVWAAAYAAADPTIGSAEDVADAAAWHDDPQRLAALLVDCGFLDVLASGALAVHDLWDHAPPFVRNRWRRKHRGEAPPWCPDGNDGDSGNDEDGSGISSVRKTCSREHKTRTMGRGGKGREERKAAPAAPPRPVENGSLEFAPNLRVLTRLCYELPDGLADEADRKDELKRLAARYHLDYDATSITRALDRAWHAKRAPAWVRELRPAPRRRMVH